MLEGLVVQLRGVARSPAPLLYEAQGSHEQAHLLARLQELPCVRCTLQAACETSLGSLETLTRHRRELVKTITTLQARVTGEFERRLRLLQHLHYVEEHGPLTANGRWAREIRHPHELVVCELLRRQLATVATPEEFAALLAALTTERPPRRLVGHPPLFGLPELLRDLQRFEQQHGIPSPHLGAILAPVPQRWLEPEEDEEGEPQGRPPSLQGIVLPSAGERRAACLYRWATGTPWQQLVSWAEIAAGDLERLILQTAELLHQIEHLLLPGYGRLAHAARQAILRAPVA
jgi:superfamily II RNA helicase